MIANQSCGLSHLPSQILYLLQEALLHLLVLNTHQELKLALLIMF